MRDYKRAMEILGEIDAMLADEEVFRQSEEDRFNDDVLLEQIARDFPEVPADELRFEVVALLAANAKEQFIVYKNKRYLLYVPSLRVISYIHECIDREAVGMLENDEIEGNDNVNFINMCIDIARKCVSEIKYRNDKLRSLLGELSQI